MFEKIRIGLKNFAHNLLSLIHHLFTAALIVGGIVLCSFYAAPLLPVLFYGLVTAVVGCILFNAAHKVVDFLANMFSGSSPNVTAEPIVLAEVTAEPMRSSTQKVNVTLASHSVKPSVVDAHTQTQTTDENRVVPLKLVKPTELETVDSPTAHTATR